MRVQPITRRAGFTLVEILVAVAILAVLAAIAFPVASRIREKGRTATCSSHLKQIALAMQQYVQDFDGHYPEAGLRFDEKKWAGRIATYLGNPQVLLCPTRDALGIGVGNDLNISNALSYDFNVLRLNNAASRRLVGRSEAAVVLASQVWLNTDGYVIGPHSYPPGPSACGDWWLPRWGQELHSGGANYSFADGHVKWLSPEQIEKIECDLGDPNFRAP